MGWFFSKAAVVTFGGAYAVLSYVDQAAVATYGWLQPGQMTVGLGLAESTPGPLIMVLEFVGFVGAYQNPGGPAAACVAGVLGATVTVWATFAPCFLWVFLGGPYVERLRGQRQARLGAADRHGGGRGRDREPRGVVRDRDALPRGAGGVGPRRGVPVPVWSSSIRSPSRSRRSRSWACRFLRWNVVPVILASAVAGLVVGLL